MATRDRTKSSVDRRLAASDDATAGLGREGTEWSAEWLAQSELVILHAIVAGSVTRTVEVPGFQTTAPE